MTEAEASTQRLLGALDRGFTDIAEQLKELVRDNDRQHGELHGEVKILRSDVDKLKSDVNTILGRVKINTDAGNIVLTETGRPLIVPQWLYNVVVGVLTALYADHVTGAHGHTVIGKVLTALAGK